MLNIDIFKLKAPQTVVISMLIVGTLLGPYLFLYLYYKNTFISLDFPRLILLVLGIGTCPLVVNSVAFYFWMKEKSKEKIKNLSGNDQDIHIAANCLTNAALLNCMVFSGANGYAFLLPVRTAKHAFYAVFGMEFFFLVYIVLMTLLVFWASAYRAKRNRANSASPTPPGAEQPLSSSSGAAGDA